MTVTPQSADAGLDRKGSPLEALRKRWQRAHQSSPYASNAAITLSTNAFIAALGLISGPLLARLLGPAGRGELAAIQSWPLFVAGIAMIGMPEALVYFSSREPARAGRVTSTAILLALVFMPLFAFIGWALAPLLLKAQSAEIIHAARWYLLAILPAYAIVYLPIHALRSHSSMVAWNLLRTAPTLTWLIVIMIALVRGIHSAEKVAFIFVAALAGTALVVIGCVRWRVPGSFAPDLSSAKPLLKYGGYSALGTLAQFLNMRVDLILIGAFLAPQALGYYAVAAAWSGAVGPILSAFASLQLSRVAKAEGIAAQSAAIVLGARLAATAAYLLLAILLPLTPLLVPLLFGANFRPAVLPACILLLATTTFGLNGILGEALRGMGKPEVVLRCELGGWMVLGVAIFALLRPFGTAGVASGALIGYVTTLMLLVRSLRRHCGCSAGDLFRPSQRDFVEMKRRLQGMVRGSREVQPDVL